MNGWESANQIKNPFQFYNSMTTQKPSHRFFPISHQAPGGGGIYS